MELETLHIFDAYTQGRLSETESKAFEARLVSDPELKKEFEEYIHIVNGVRAHEQEKIKKQLQQRGLHRTEHGSWKAYRTVAAIAAVALLLIIPAYVIYRISTQSSRLASEYYIEDPGLPVTMGASANSQLNQAMVEYKDKQFQASLDKIMNLLSGKPDNDTLNYYAGICLYQLGETDKAIERFENVTDAGSAFYFRAKYNLAISLLKNGNSSEASMLLKAVSDDGPGTFREKATELLNKI
jgi:tetratricopeptide (TPR) repeat protein